MHVFTSAITNYLPKARVLAESVKRHHPEAKFHLVLSDEPPPGLAADGAPFDSVITIGELGIPDTRRWIFMHSIVELCTGVKGAAFQYLIKRHGDGEPVLYLDPDIVVFSRLDGVTRRFTGKSVLLTPHIAVPESSLDAIMDNELGSLKHGVYNLGFLGVKPDAAGRAFVDWWAARLQLFCYDNIPAGVFTDQRWVDLAMVFFHDDIGLIRDPECNVATWNLTNRHATGSLKEGVLINGRPLCFYHFSGFDSGAQERMLDKYGSGMGALYELRKWYIAECERLGQEEYGARTWKYGFFDNGELIQRQWRKQYRVRQDLQRMFPRPFETADPDASYYHWCVKHTPLAP